jgi:hypothetical protein
VRIATKGGEASGKPLAYVIIGDGYTEVRILEAIGDKLNHSEVLLYVKWGISIGLSAALDTLAKLFSLDKRVSKYLLIIDREHVKSVDDIINGLLARGFTISGEERCYAEACHIFTVEKGGRRGAVVVSIQGKERCIEENIAELIRMHYNENVSSDKKSHYGVVQEKRTQHKGGYRAQQLRAPRESISRTNQSTKHVKTCTGLDTSTILNTIRLWKDLPKSFCR